MSHWHTRFGCKTDYSHTNDSLYFTNYNGSAIHHESAGPFTISQNATQIGANGVINVDIER